MRENWEKQKRGVVIFGQKWLQEILTMTSWKADANELPGCDGVLQSDCQLIWSATETHKKGSDNIFFLF